MAFDRGLPHIDVMPLFLQGGDEVIHRLFGGQTPLSFLFSALPICLDLAL